MSISSINHTVNNLHTFTMIYILTSTLIKSKNPNSFIKGTSNKLTTSWRIIQINNSSYMIFMHNFSSTHFPHIKRITIRILTANSKINRLNRIKSQTWTFIIQINFLNRWFSSQIIQNNRSINPSSTYNITIRWIIFNFKNCIYIPL